MVKLTIQAIVPKNTPSSKAYMSEIRKALGKFAARVQNDLKAPTRTWDTVVVFRTHISEQGTALAAEITTDSQVYAWVNEGTKPHIIRPKKARALRFRWGGYGSYKAKTMRGSLSSRKGGATGDIVFRKEVHHPGFEGREFTATVVKKREKELQTDVQNAINTVNGRTS